MQDENNKSSVSSRRTVLKAGASLAAGAAVVPSGEAKAQDAELARLQGARRILIKGGIVLTLDRAVGDFAQADLLIEDGKIRRIEAIFHRAPYGTPSGWSTYEQGMSDQPQIIR